MDMKTDTEHTLMLNGNACANLRVSPFMKRSREMADELQKMVRKNEAGSVVVLITMEFVGIRPTLVCLSANGSDKHLEAVCELICEDTRLWKAMEAALYKDLIEVAKNHKRITTHQ